MVSAGASGAMALACGGGSGRSDGPAGPEADAFGAGPANVSRTTASSSAWTPVMAQSGTEPIRLVTSPITGVVAPAPERNELYALPLTKIVDSWSPTSAARAL